MTMDFFAKPDTPSDGVMPFTRERVQAYLDARGDSYGRDDDGDLYGRWEGHLFYFLALGQQNEIFQIRGRWSKVLPLSSHRDVALQVNDWNRDRLWPKAYVRVIDDQLFVFGETATDLEHGVTKDQLAQLITCGMVTTIQLFEWLSDQFPHAQEFQPSSE